MGRVFILGAGISREVQADAPLSSELLPLALKLRDGRHGRLRALRAFIHDFYRLDFNVDADGADANLPPLEDVLSQLDYCLIEGRAISGTYSLSKLAELRECAVYAICRVLADSLEHSAQRANYGPMDAFVKRLRPDDTVISLNYDLIADNRISPDGHIDYGAHIFERGQRGQPPRRQHAHRLLKLHGSLNWIYCPACQAMDYIPARKAAVHFFERDEYANCSVCGARCQPVIIPPTFLKDYSNAYIRQIWIEAEHAIERADELTCIGYSLPDADIVLRGMLSRALYRSAIVRGRGDGDRGLPAITIVDKQAVGGTLDENQQATRLRYARLFGQVDYRAVGFETFAAETAPEPG